jgi:hypothetical protein
MYLFDPDRGRRRRALLRDQWVHWTRDLGHALEVALRDLGHRASGLAAEARWMFVQDHASDATIEARVRSALGRAASHPRAIRVVVQDGRVVLSGPVLAAEVENVIEAARRVRGVRGVENRLEVHSKAGDHPALQGGVPRTGPRPELLQENWSPATRLLVGLGGGLLALKAMRRPELAVLALGAVGLGVAASLANQAPSRARQGGSPRRFPRESRVESLEEMPWASP